MFNNTLSFLRESLKHTTIGVNWLITLGGQNQPWVLGTLIYKAVKLERREDWFEPILNTHTHLSPTLIPVFFICPSSTQQPKK
jgi:hypothetical protein